MDDERERLEIDMRLRNALAPDEAAARRVIARALASDHVAAPSRRFGAAPTAVAIVCAALLAVIGVWRWRVAPPPIGPPASLAISGHGSIVVADSPDGRRWIVGPAPARTAAGRYVIVVPQ